MASENDPKNQNERELVNQDETNEGLDLLDDEEQASVVGGIGRNLS